eukprot:3743794-Rhodomonas_salina.5
MEVGVHIADVSFFVRARTTPYPKPLHLILTPYSMPLRLLLYKICVSYDVRLSGTELDQEAQKRATSTYLVQVPMSLQMPYAMSSTDLQYAATDSVGSWYWLPPYNIAIGPTLAYCVPPSTRTSTDIRQYSTKCMAELAFRLGMVPPGMHPYASARPVRGLLFPYRPPTRSPVLTYCMPLFSYALAAIGLRACYAMPGTDIAYAAAHARAEQCAPPPPMVLGAPYAMSGTDIGYGPTRHCDRLAFRCSTLPGPRYSHTVCCYPSQRMVVWGV